MSDNKKILLHNNTEVAMYTETVSCVLAPINSHLRPRGALKIVFVKP